MSRVALVLFLTWQSAAASQAPPALTDDDVAVVNAAITGVVRPQHDRLSRVARSEIQILNRTMPICTSGRSPSAQSGCVGIHNLSRLTNESRSQPRYFSKRITKAAAAAIARDFVNVNQEAASVPTARIVGVTGVEVRDVSLPYAAFSRPAYNGDRWALTYVTYTCGGQCGQGWLVLFEKSGDVWHVSEAAMIWIA